jgi:apolipoprotein N-acyltransferase
VNICYEDIFPGQVRMLMQGGRDRQVPEVMFNVTNDSWYGDTIQPLEHLVLASFRSIEHRRALVRSTNTGISAIVDPAGRISHRTAQWKSASLSGRIPMMQGRTVYAVAGDWIGWVCAVIALLGLVRAFRAPGRFAGSGAAERTPSGRRKGKRHRDNA